MPRSIRLIFLAGVAVIFVYFIREAFSGDEQYVAALEKEREEKDRSFKQASNSPFEGEAQAAFTNLTYYAPDPAFRVEGTYAPLSQPDTVRLPMTKGEEEAYIRFATSTFTLPGQPKQTVVLFKRIGDQKQELFLPFTDKTNGFDTYGGGRYLDVPLPPAGSSSITIDFNQAYNPFCAYNDEFACPVPPADNRLPIPIPVGEQEFQK